MGYKLAVIVDARLTQDQMDKRLVNRLMLPAFNRVGLKPGPGREGDGKEVAPPSSL